MGNGSFTAASDFRSRQWVNCASANLRVWSVVEVRTARQHPFTCDKVGAVTKFVSDDPNLILSPGTQVVTLVEISGDSEQVLHPIGAVGVVLKSPEDLTHSYRVQFPDGVEGALKQNQLVMLAKFREGAATEHLAQHRDGMFERVIFRCVIGSRAYGLEDESSDIDYRGIYLPHADLHWSLSGVPEQIECDATQEVYWELQKFIILALKSNPNILECLYSPVVEFATPLANELLAMRDCFVSKLVYQTFNGYVMSQFKKMQADIRNHGSVKWKHVMHLIRLLLSGTHALTEGQFKVRVEDHRDQLLAIKRGDVAWEEAEALRLDLQRKFEAAFRKTKLPEQPNYKRANAFLIKARHAALGEDLP